MSFDRQLALAMARDDAWEQLHDYMLDAALDGNSQLTENELDVIVRRTVYNLKESHRGPNPIVNRDGFLRHYMDLFDEKYVNVKSINMDHDIKSLRAKYKAIYRSSQVDEFRRDIDHMLQYAHELMNAVYEYEAEENNNRLSSLRAAANQCSGYRTQLRTRPANATEQSTLQNFVRIIDESVRVIDPQLPVMEQYDHPAASELGHVRDHLSESIRRNITSVIELIERQHFDDNLVVRMATQMDRNNDYSAAPILADALEDAGFNDQQVLRALRSGASNVPYLIRQIAGRGMNF